MPLLMILPVLFIALTFLYLPFSGPERFFSMRVHPEWFAGREAQAIRRKYRLAVGVVTALSVLFGFLSKAHPSLIFVAVAFEVVGLGVAWSWGWKRTLPFAWQGGITRTAALQPSPSVWRWTAAALVPICGTAIVLLAHYQTLPAAYAIHFSQAGVPNHFVQKSWIAVFGPLMMCGTVVVALAGLLRAVQRQGAGIADNGRYSKLTGRFVLGVAWMVGLACAATGLLPMLPSASEHASRLGFAVGAIDVTFLFFTTAFLIMNRKALISGQSTTDVAHWRAGLLYFNREDGALFVPKRLGFGWTVNWAQPGAWLVMGVILVLVCLPFAFRHL